jgi:enterobacterial common antigen flippase
LSLLTPVAAGRAEVAALLRHTQIRDTAATSGVNIAIMVAGSLGGLVLARALGPTNRGDLVVILQWPAAIGAVASVGLTQATVFCVARMREQSLALMSTAIVAALASGITVAAFAPSLAHEIGRTSEVRTDLQAILALTPLYIAGGVWMSAIQATNIAAWNLARILQPIGYLLAVVALWTAGLLSLLAVVIAFAVSIVGQTIVALLIARRVVGRHRRPVMGLLRPLYSYGAKVWLASVPQLVIVSVDQLLLSIMPNVPVDQLGNYSVAVSLSWLALPASTAFGSVAFPSIARRQGSDSIEHIERIALFGATLTAGAAIAVISLLAPTVVPRLLGVGYADSIIALWILAPGTVFLALNRVLGDVLQGRGRPLIRSIGEVFGALLTMALLLVLIPPYGIRGAAIASTLTYAAVFVCLFVGLLRVRTQSRTSLVSC